jgi:CelD/BcsL family acetyltransferase involved in cellulose biosynthesis
MEQQISIRCVESLREFEELRKAWNLLAEAHTEQTVFLTWEWLYAWWKRNQEGKNLWLLTAYQQNELVGIAPLMLVKLKKHGMSFRLLQTLGTPNTDQSCFITLNNNPEIVMRFCEHMVAHKDKWDAIELNEHKDEDTATHIITSFLENHGLVTKINSNLHYHIEITKPWDVFYKSLSRNMRHDIEKTIRHANEAYNINLKHFRGVDVRWEYFETLFEINKNGHFPEKYRPEKERAFHRELFETMRENNWIEIVLLYFDDKPVAYEYGFTLNGRFEDWRTGYDTNYKEQSAGKLLLILLLKELFEQGYQDFDFLRGEYEHKDRWKPSAQKFLNITAVQPGHIQAQIALITMPKIWKWLKIHILHKQGETH